MFCQTPYTRQRTFPYLSSVHFQSFSLSLPELRKTCHTMHLPRRSQQASLRSKAVNLAAPAGQAPLSICCAEQHPFEPLLLSAVRSYTTHHVAPQLSQPSPVFRVELCWKVEQAPNGEVLLVCLDSLSQRSGIPLLNWVACMHGSKGRSTNSAY